MKPREPCLLAPTKPLAKQRSPPMPTCSRLRMRDRVLSFGARNRSGWILLSLSSSRV